MSRNVRKALATMFYLALSVIQLSCGVENSPSISIFDPAAGVSDSGASVAYMFLSASTDGSIGGRVGADALCAARYAASYSSLGCDNTRAFISVDAADEISDMPTNYGVPTSVPIRRPDDTAIAAGFSDLIAGLAINLTNAVSTVVGPVWTGATTTGGLDADSCSGWTSNNGGLFSGIIGVSSNTGTNYIQAASQTCDNSRPIYCICW